MNYKSKKIKKLPDEFKFLWCLLGDAQWLIAAELEKRGFFNEGEKVIPRDIILRIRSLPSKKKLPLVLNSRVSFGKAYDPIFTLKYSSGAYEMGTPSMYLDDPSEYWTMKDGTNYLTKNYPKKKDEKGRVYRSTQSIPVLPRDRKV